MNRAKTIIPFLITILAFLYLANFVVYEAILLIFNINGSSFLVMGILAIFGISFIVSIFLGRSYYNIFTRVYGTLAMAWMGFFGYFFIASALYVLEFSFIGDPEKIFALILFGLASVSGVYGIFHARKIVVKEVKVMLPKLPQIWQGRKAFWISDLHVGQINGRRYVESVVEKLKDLKPDILFIGGDLFDGSSAEGILDCISAIKELKIPLGIYFVTGNHEVYGNKGRFMEKISEVGIRILNNEKIIIDNLQIVGVDYTDTAKENDFKKVLKELSIDTNIPSILLKHEPNHIDIAEEVGISLQISGHTHKAQQWPFEYFARLAYGRFTYGLNKFKNLKVYTSSGTGTWGPPMRVGTDSEIVIFTFI